MKFNNEYNSFNRINTLPFHNYFIPFHKDDEIKYIDKIIDKKSSSLLTLLNGNWDIKGYKDLSDINSLDVEFDKKIIVPSCVQLNGYDQNQYVNYIYPFEYNPINAPKINPSFHYHRKFNILKKENKKYILAFEGVDSAFYLYINKQYVGYSQITHSLSEFDITSYLNEFENDIDVIVLKWCAGSYLEDQDKFRFTGIIRDVYILERDFKYISDYKIETDYDNEYAYITFINNSNVDININFNNSNYKCLKEKSIQIKFKNYELWSDTNPYLYKMILTSDNEKIIEHIGIRKTYIKDSIYYINDKKIKLKGVNRHETHPLKGSAIDVYDTLKDIKIIKELNINAIRTSHYPDMPEFYMLCDAYGIYVIDEADVEAHGIHSAFNYDLKSWDLELNKGLFEEGIYQREVSLYERDKNFTSVIIFSLGNEASFGSDFFRGLDYIYTRDKRAIHYEGQVNCVNKVNQLDPRISFRSRMYPSIDYLKEMINDKTDTRPIILCEYSHSMGNSNGDLKDYWDLINANDIIMGAFVWEFCDHAIYNKEGKLCYGGDFNETLHDGNFCVDGLLTSEREYKSNTYELFECYKGNLNYDKEISKCKKLNSLNKNNPIEIKLNSDASLSILNKDISNIKLNFLRAFIDNDSWAKNDIDIIKNSNIKINKTNRIDNVIYNDVSLIYEDEEIMNIKLDYTLYNNAIDVAISYKIIKDGIFIQRIGIEFDINKNNDEFIFFGYGKNESYIDKRLSSKINEYKLKVNDNFLNNLKPQECGSHYYSSYLIFNDIRVDAVKPFSFNALPYSRENIETSKHIYDLKKEDRTFVSIDVNMAGIGTGSCGPRLLEKYWIKKSDFNHFRITFLK